MFDFGIESVEKVHLGADDEWCIDFRCGCGANTQSAWVPELDCAFIALYVAPVFCHSGCEYSRALGL